MRMVSADREKVILAGIKLKMMKVILPVILAVMVAIKVTTSPQDL